MKEFETDGIVLNRFDFREKERILHLFTPEHGVLHVIAKKLSPKNLTHASLTSPLTRGRYHVLQGRSDLLKFKDGTVDEMHLGVRGDYDRLEAALGMLRLVNKTQLPDKPAPQLYHLLRIYLKALEVGSARHLHTSFAIKLLKHDGMLSEGGCGHCELEASRWMQGERFCKRHAPAGSIGIDLALVDAIAGVRKLSDLYAMPISESFYREMISNLE
ncbi:MAG: DNA repair protein RecO [Simkaniaceae bacterium]|nr:DNA repair protein RecO [Simkaniaceae bacterium]